MPTSGKNYAAWVSNETDLMIQKAALRLKLRDERGRIIEPKTLPTGQKEVSRYAITKSLLLELASGYDRTKVLTEPEE